MSKEFGTQTRSDYLGERVKQYPHPHDPDLLITIKSASTGRMNRYGKAASKGGTLLKTETYKLVAESIVDASTHEPVFSDEDVPKMGDFDCQFITGLIQLIGFHNGQKETDFEELVGNFEETE